MTPTLADLATTQNLLLVSDFDGTLAGIVPDPAAVPVQRRSLGALARLAGLPGTTVAVLSGRGMADLRQVCPLREPVLLAGSHGAESGEHGVAVPPEMTAALDSVAAELSSLTRPDASVYVELKPFQTVFHVAPLAERDPAAARELLAQARLVYAHGTTVAGGKNIVEFSVGQVTKGTWLAAERARVGAERTVFIGDDVTDENGFAALGAQDLGVKVGPGESRASRRLADREEVAEWLTQLASARAAHTGIPREPAARFRAVAAGFTAVAVQVTEWGAQTPCEQWVARDLIFHLCFWYQQNLELAGVDLGLSADPQADPLGAWYELAQAVQELLADPVRSAAVYTDGPDQGVTVAEATNSYFIPDVFLHSWDLARSQGLEVELDPDYAARQLAGLREQGEMIQDGGQFAAPRRVAEDAPLVDKLMAFIGRDPAFGLPAARG